MVETHVSQPTRLFFRKSKKLIDAYVQTCELVEKRSKTPERSGSLAAVVGPMPPPGLDRPKELRELEPKAAPKAKAQGGVK